MPPHLAGREAFKQDIYEILQYLSEPCGVQSDLILYGPRGTGKTVLLQWLKDHCMDGHGDTVLRITPSSTVSLKEHLMAGLGTAAA